jgi:hypothetical protein
MVKRRNKRILMVSLEVMLVAVGVGVASFKIRFDNQLIIQTRGSHHGCKQQVHSRLRRQKRPTARHGSMEHAWSGRRQVVNSDLAFLKFRIQTF